jgi:cation transport ATPase
MKIKILISLLLIGLNTIPSFRCFSQDDIPIGTTSINRTITSDDVKKEKKNQEDSFFTVQIDKLSEKFFTRLIINFLSVLILIRFIYFPNYKKRELFFTFFTFNMIIFMITYLLNKVDMGLGAAFGLFAVFSMLRYRTENISAKDMTYLFLAIAIGLITSISKASAFELSLLNSLILLITFFLEGSLFQKKELTQSIQYENIEMIRPNRHPALIMDLKERTGLNIHRISIGKVNFLKDTAMVQLYYYEDEGGKLISPSPEVIDNNVTINK